MAISFPTSLDNFSNPASTDSLNTPSHSLQHTDLNDAVEALEAKVGVGASPAGSATSGQVLMAGTAGTTTWSNPDYVGAWTSYTPTFTNLTVGNSTVVAKYKQIGKTVFVSMKFTRGSTGSIGTTPTMSLPVNNATNSLFPGIPYYEDTGTAGYVGYLLIDSNVVYFGIQNVAGTYPTTGYISATVPFTWTTNDNINIQFCYEAA